RPARAPRSGGASSQAPRRAGPLDRDLSGRDRGRGTKSPRQGLRCARATGGAGMTVLEPLATVIADLLRDDPRRVLLGEDVKDGGMRGLSRHAAGDEALTARLVSTPLVPTILAAHAGGMAVAGLRPIVLLPSVASLVEALAGLR